MHCLLSREEGSLLSLLTAVIFNADLNICLPIGEQFHELQYTFYIVIRKINVHFAHLALVGGVYYFIKHLGVLGQESEVDLHTPIHTQEVPV